MLLHCCLVVLSQYFESRQKFSRFIPAQFRSHLSKTFHMMPYCLATKLHSNFGVINRLFNANLIFGYFQEACRTASPSGCSIFDAEIFQQRWRQSTCWIVAGTFLSFPFTFSLAFGLRCDDTTERSWREIDIFLFLLQSINKFKMNFKRIPIASLSLSWSPLRSLAKPSNKSDDTGLCFRKKHFWWNQLACLPS